LSLQLQFVLKWPYCYYHQLVQVVFGPFTKLAGERVTVTVVQLSEVLGRLIENWRRYKLESALTLIS
jgi:hypothetical protein